MVGKVYFIIDNLSIGKPITSRLEAFESYFRKKKYDVVYAGRPSGIAGIRRFIASIKKTDIIFISMPPFRSFWLFLIPGLRVVLDIRDGWSIAQLSGYGGIVKKKQVKPFFTRAIERALIRRAWLTITCTPGLKEYLEKLSSRTILLIPNGVSKSDLKVIKGAVAEVHGQRDELVFCCSGKFSEYGEEKVKKLFSVILARYAGYKIKVILIGCDYHVNKWVVPYFENVSNGVGGVEFIARLERNNLLLKMNDADFGLSIVRDPDYELGTKIYDYLALGLKVVNYFDRPNNFTDYFDACLDVPFNDNSSAPEICRDFLIERVLDEEDIG